MGYELSGCCRLEGLLVEAGSFGVCSRMRLTLSEEVLEIWEVSKLGATGQEPFVKSKVPEEVGIESGPDESFGPEESGM